MLGMKARDNDDIDIVSEDETSTSGFKGKSEKKLREELKICQKEKQEYLEGWQRAKADLINFKREAETSRTSFARFATEDLIAELLPVLDSFRMAFSHKPPDGDGSDWLKGMEHVYKQLLAVLEGRGVRQIDPTGNPFNPQEHDSVATVPVTEKSEDGTVVETVQLGYALNDKIIRAAKVKVGEFEN